MAEEGVEGWEFFGFFKVFCIVHVGADGAAEGDDGTAYYVAFVDAPESGSSVGVWWGVCTGAEL